MRGSDFKKIFESLYPTDYAYSWDNVGLQVGTLKKEINNILISLDLTEEVIIDAINDKCELILVHHPLIFSPLKTIITDTFKGKALELLIKNDIALYVAHTNFDIAKEGMNDILSNILNFEGIEVLESLPNNPEEGLGRTGYIKETSMKEYIATVKIQLNVSSARFIGDLNATVKKVAIVGGSGSSAINSAIEKNVDLFISGDIGYHHALDALAMGLNILDVGHNIENLFAPKLKETLKNNGITANMIISEVNTNPYQEI